MKSSHPQKPSQIKRPPPLRPNPQPFKIPTPSPKPPPQKARLHTLRRLKGRIRIAHDALTQVFETMRRVVLAVETEIEIFTAGGGGEVCAAESVLW